MCISAKEIVNILSALLGPIIAAVVAYIAIQQYRLEKFKIRQQLYERRSTIYKAVMEFLSRIVQNANIEYEHIYKFLRETAESLMMRLKIF